MRERSLQAKEDWMEQGKDYRNLKANLLRDATSEREKNALKRGFERVRIANERDFIKGRLEHQEKVQWLKNRVKDSQTEDLETCRRQELENLREQWLESIVNTQEETIPPPNVPIYGQVELDRDEIACAMLPPKYTSYPVLNPSNMKFEGICTNTKVRWSRATTGGPRDQLEDLTEFGEMEEQSEEQELFENQHRTIYSYERKTLDFRK